ncbi:MAG TPA: glycine zipper 2TM domain-containing protein [Steroidobacteraceae bacterium]
MFKRTILTSLVASGLALSAGAAFAEPSNGSWGAGADDDSEGTGYDYAPVVAVQPLTRAVRISAPQRECYQQTRLARDDYDGHDELRASSAGATLLGGIIGAAIGNQIGQGDGRRLATAAGAVIGASIGHDAAERRAAERDAYYESAPRAYTVERCDTRYRDRWEQRIEGYRVTYLYNGRRLTTQLPYDPGPRIRVRVDVSVDES